MSDSVKKWHEMLEENKVDVFAVSEHGFVEVLLSNEQKLLDIDQALKEYEGNVIDKWRLINRIEEIMSR